MAARTAFEDPIKSFRFRVVIDNVVRAGFTECAGVSKETDVVEYREGGMNETPQKSAGLTKYNDITLKRGQIFSPLRGGNDDFKDWASAVNNTATLGNSPTYRRTMTIQQFDATNALVAQWLISNAWPKTFTPFSDLNGTANENSIETLVLAHEGFEPV